jgi:hypothetical protein
MFFHVFFVIFQITIINAFLVGRLPTSDEYYYGMLPDNTCVAIYQKKNFVQKIKLNAQTTSLVRLSDTREPGSTSVIEGQIENQKSQNTLNQIDFMWSDLVAEFMTENSACTNNIIYYKTHNNNYISFFTSNKTSRQFARLAKIISYRMSIPQLEESKRKFNIKKINSSLSKTITLTISKTETTVPITTTTTITKTTTQNPVSFLSNSEKINYIYLTYALVLLVMHMH